MADLIALGNDHRGFALKRFLSDKLTSFGYEVMDFGTDGSAPVDYPEKLGEIIIGALGGI